MKKLIIILITFTAFLSNAQIKLKNIGHKNSDFEDVVITLENGNIVTGMIKNFHNETIKPDLFDAFSTLETQADLGLKKYQFKKDKNSPLQPLSLDSVKTVVVMKDRQEIIRWDKLKVKKVMGDLSLKEAKREIFMPLYREGKINMYVLAVESSHINPQTKAIETSFDVLCYLKNANDEYSIAPIDSGNTAKMMINMFSLKDMIITGFKEVGKDCPEFVEKLNEPIDKAQKKEARRESMENLKIIEKEFREQGLKGDDLALAMSLQPYFMIIKQYENSCQ